MILLVQIICLCYTLYVLQEYATSGAYSRQHRLLPLLVGLIGVYNFYQVVLTLTGQTELFGRLKDMLLIQVLYLILIYIMDFLKIHIPYGVQWIMFCVLLALNVIVFMRYRQPEIYHIYFRIYLIGCTAAIVAMGTYAYLRRSLTMHEHQIANLLYIVLLVNAAAMCAEKFFTIPGNLLMLAATTGVCGAVHYLIQTDQLMDTGELLRERLYDDSDTAVVLLDTNFYCVDANRSGRSLFAGPMQLYERNSRRHRGYMQEAEELAKSIQEGKKSREIEKNGQYYQCQCTPVYYSGRLRGYILGAWDITSPKKETQLMQALKGKAEMQTARKSDFLAQMSHDLKSPLHAIIGITDILSSRKELTASDRALLLHIKGAGNSLVEQVNAILDYSRIEAGKFELMAECYRLDQVLEEVAHMCVINLQSKRVWFEACIQGEFPEKMYGDAMRVREILQNLLANAVKFTEEGEIRCVITCEAIRDSSDVMVRCRVSDTGTGMTSEQLRQGFDSYVSYAAESGQSGNGLGLSIVKELANRMGGSVRAESNGTRGTTITVEIRQKVCGSTLHDAVCYTTDSLLRESVVYTERIQPTWIYPGAHVLLADDMRINQEIFQELAAPWRFTLDVVRNGKEAVEAAARKEYQLIFLDQRMPEKNGDEAAKEIRKFCDIPMVLMTADITAELKHRNRRPEFTAYLDKPIDVSELKKVIETYLPVAERRDFLLHAQMNHGAYRRLLQTFLQETGSLAAELPGYVPEQLELFGTKVHGIKGASQQIGRQALSESAEIMEMAAKTENIQYLEKHMTEFLETIRHTLESVEDELKNLPQEIQGEGAATAEDIPEEKQQILAQLREAFDACDLNGIEQGLSRFARAHLTAEERELLTELHAAYENLDYEEGSELLSGRML